MALFLGATKLCRPNLPPSHFVLHFPSLCTSSLSPETLQQTIQAAVESKAYQKIPDLLASSVESCRNPNPFSFLSAFSPYRRTQLIDEILQSLVPLRPRSRSHIVYSCLLSFTLQNPNPFPLALAIIQRILRSGSLPVPQTKLLLSKAWLDRSRRQSETVAGILSEMQSVGYRPDCGTCNYVIASLCDIDQLAEAVKVLKGMGDAGCVPDLESYGAVISAMCAARKTTDAMEMAREMVTKMRLNPRQGTLVKVVAALRANRESRKAVKMIELLEQEGYAVGFEFYESVVEGCVESKDFILAAKVVMGMTEKGFIPYIKMRQKVVDGLAAAGEWKLAATVRQRFAQLGS